MDQPINKFSGPYEFLSNFHACPVVFRGRVYMAAEHAFQAAKATNDQDHDFVASAPNPSRAKRRGRKITCRSGWKVERDEVMLEVQRAKYTCEICQPLLLATNDAYLTEGNTWHDQYWGNCTCPMHRAVAGENRLGKTIMQVREELKHANQ